MTDTKHTPGPFIVRNAGDHLTVERCDDALRSVVASMYPDEICDEHGGSAEGNAQLFASAPELLAALQCFLGHGDVCQDRKECLFCDAVMSPSEEPTHHDPACPIAKARTAIARAEGE